MKADAPEKIYVCDNVFPNHVDWEGSPINTKRIDNHDIEYICTDAFIEKANKWLSLNLKMLMNVLDVEYDTHETDIKDFVEDFKNYMKGE